MDFTYFLKLLKNPFFLSKSAKIGLKNIYLKALFLYNKSGKNRGTSPGFIHERERFMEKKTVKKFLKIVLALFMAFQNLHIVPVHADGSTWTETSWDAITADDVIAITMTKGSTTWVLPADTRTSKGTPAVAASVSGTTLTTGSGNYGWTITKGSDGSYIQNSDGKYLYVINDNNGVRVSTTKGLWKITNNYLSSSDGTNTRYLGVYLDTPDWRCYKNTTGNTSGQTLKFWKLEDGGEPAQPEEVLAQLDKFTTAPENNSKVVIYYPGDGVVLTTTASGSKLAGKTAKVEDSKLDMTATMAYLTVSIDSDGYYTFTDESGKVLTAVVGSSSTGLSFEATASDNSLWSLEQQADGTWYIASVNAVYNSKQQYLEYYNGFTTYGMNSSVDQFKFEFYGTHSGDTPTGETHTVNVITPEDGGQISVDKTEVVDGGKVEITVTPNNGAELLMLLINEVDHAAEVVDNKLSFTVNEDIVIRANFLTTGVDYVTVTVLPSEHGTISVPFTKIECDQDVTIFFEAEEGYELTSLLITHDDVTEDLLDEAHSNYKPYEEDGKTCYYFTTDWNITIQGIFEKPAPQGVEWEKMTEAPRDGSTLVIFYPAGNQVLTATVSGKKLAGVAAEPADGKILVTEQMAQLTVHEADGVYTFENNGKYLTSGTTGNALSFADDGTSDLAKWTLEKKTDGTWVIMNVGAAYNGNHNQALEYYSGFTTYGVKDTAAYKFDFYGTAEKDGTDPVTPTEGEKYGLSTTLEDGDKVIIFNNSNGRAVGNSLSGYNVTGIAYTPVDGIITTDSTDAVWTVVKNSDGTYSFTHGEKTLGGVVSGTHNNLVVTGGTYNKWSLVGPDTSDQSFFLYVTEMPSNFEHLYLEYYNGNFSLWGMNGTPDKPTYGFSFYKQGAEPETPVIPSDGEKYGLTSTLATGDKVILYNEASGLGVGNTIVSHKVAGVSLTPVDDVITTNETAVVWEVTKNSDGTYTFKQGDKVLGGIVTEENGKTYNNLVVTGAEHTKWTLRGMEATDLVGYMYLDSMQTNYGKMYIEYYNGFTLYGQSNPTPEQYGIKFYKQGAEPEHPNPEAVGDLVTSLDQLKDGATVAIYSQGHKTAISSKPNGDWYLRANNCTVEQGKVVNFTSDMVWIVRINEDGTYSFYSNNDPDSHSITVWPSDKYAEVCLDYISYPDNTWELSPAKNQANAWYFKSPTVSWDRGPAYLEAYVRNDCEVFSGYFTTPSASNFKDDDFALRFYLVNPEDAVEILDDGEWDGVLNKGESYIFYNMDAQKSVGLYKAANYAMDAIDTTFEGDLAYPGNGAYYFKVDTMGRYYTFEINGKYLATNPSEEVLFVDKTAEGKVPEEAKWFLYEKTTDSGQKGYVIYNKECRYNGTPVCLEYFSSVFSGWTFSTSKNKLEIYLFNFYHVGDDVKVYEDIVQDPSVVFDCEDYRYVEQDYKVSFTLDDLAEEITSIAIKYVIGNEVKTVTDYEVTSGGKGYTFVIPAADIDGDAFPESFKLVVEVKNSYDIEYTGEKTIEVIDEPFFENPTPKPNSQTGDEKKPVISVKIGNVGTDPTFVMTVNDVEVEAVYENGILSYTPAADMEDGRVSVHVKVTRKDGVASEKGWSFTIGVAPYQLYFGQLHSHTTYSDGSGTLETALEYISSLPESANVQFVAFTDHSNYFDTTSAANPADAMNDKSLMYEASRALWEEYKNTIARFNEKHDNLIAIGGYEMTWSGGPGHINSFNTDGLVSRNNAELNKKTGDAGMKLYYSTIKKDSAHQTLHQFNHPGNTFGNFTDFAYWDAALDSYMFLVEVGNGEGQIGAGGYYPSYEQYIMALDKGWHLAPTNNQDNHKGRWGNANDARDVILTNDFSEEGIYEAIRNLRVYATEDKNLQITYTVNGQPMGTVFSDKNPLKEMNVEITLYDPDTKDRIVKVELVSDGGVTTYTWDDASEIAEGLLTCTMNAEDSYYFVRVTQEDGDLAVTSPVWARSPFQVGIDTLETEDGSTKVYVNEPFTLVTTLYNNEEDVNATITSITYTYNGNEVLGTYSTETALNANSTAEITFTPSGKLTTAKMTEITATAVVVINGKQHTYTKTLTLEVVDRQNENKITPIIDVRRASKKDDVGYIFNIEGVVSSNASGYDRDTAFFDCIYVQDATGGICCFPVSGEFKIGDKVRIHGYTDFYQGEPELQVVTIEIIDELQTPYELETTEIKAAQLNNRSVEGKLVTIKGTVDSYQIANGLVQTIMIKDAAGRLARVFIDGYITTNNEVKWLEEGVEIEATGIASYDDTFYLEEGKAGPFPRIRIRDRADVIVAVHDHEWGEPTYEWSEDNSTVTATRICTLNEKHVETETVETTKTVADPTCEEAGTITYEAVFENEAFEKQTKTVEGEPATGHKWGEPTYEWSEDNSTVTATRVCENDPEHVETETAQTTKTVVEPTETEDGKIIYTVEFENEAFEKQTKEVAGDPAVFVYTVVEGADAEWVKGSGEDQLIVVKRSKDDSTTFDHFVRIEVDGRVLDEENYDAVSGSVRATLKSAYLETLSEGEHTVKLVFDDGEVSTTLSISPESTPVTGDSSMIVIYSMLMALSAVAFIALYFGRKQEDVQKA